MPSEYIIASNDFCHWGLDNSYCIDGEFNVDIEAF